MQRQFLQQDARTVVCICRQVNIRVQLLRSAHIVHENLGHGLAHQWHDALIGLLPFLAIVRVKGDGKARIAMQIEQFVQTHIVIDNGIFSQTGGGADG